MNCWRITRRVVRAGLLLAVAGMHERPIFAAGEADKDVRVSAKGNLLENDHRPRASSGLAGFDAAQAVDGSVRGAGGDNGLIFADDDADQRLAVGGFESAVREIRLFTNTADPSRLFERVTVRSSTRPVDSLDPADYETELFAGTPPEYDRPAGDPPDAQVLGASIAVVAPPGTRSLLLSFGPARGSGDRVSEVQAFADPPPPAPPAEPRARVTLAPDGGSVTALGWDTETGRRARTNLLRGGAAVVLQARRGGRWGAAGGNAARFDYTDTGEGGFDLAVKTDAAATKDAEALRLVFPFDPRVSATTVLPARVDAAGAFHLPAVVSAPGFGQMLVSVVAPGVAAVTGTLQGSRAQKLIDWQVDVPKDAATGGAGLRLAFRPVRLPPPEGLKDHERWTRVRRGWFNVFQVTAAWGDGGHPFSAPSGVLGNNVISDPVSCCLFIYADSALWTPQAAPGVSLMDRVGSTLDWWLEKRMLPSGEVPGYWDLKDFLEANPSLLITAWDYVEATGDDRWLAARIDRLEKAAEFLASRDVDGDGLLEAVQSGNAGTLVQPARSCSAYDAVNCGHKDAYCNTLAYRAFRCLAELEGRLGRIDQQKRYATRADRLKAAFAPALLNPDTGFIAMWKSRDGKLHDYAAPFVNALAVEYGLVDAAQGRQILKRLRAKMGAAGFRRFDLGIPCTLVPVRREDYLLPQAPGLPQREDGADTFGEYLNGGVVTGDALRYLAALYTVGDADDVNEADRILDLMLDRLSRGGITAGGFPVNVVDAYPHGGEFWTWDGRTCGYEGLLSHAYHFVQAVAVREPDLRRRLHRPLNAGGDGGAGGGGVPGQP